MTQIKFTPTGPPNAENPDCPKCGKKMSLARIEPEEPAHDRRAFECPQCNRSESVVVKFR